MSAPAVYGFIEVMVEAFDLEAFGLVYPLVETVLYMMSYLVQYPRCWPFILMVSQLFVANLSSYVPLQQLLLTIVYHNSLPLPQSSLEINPQQYKGKLYDSEGNVTFENVMCVPAHFVKTLDYRQKIEELAVQTCYAYFNRRCQLQPVTLPEASNAFLNELAEIISVISGASVSKKFGYKFQYRGFQYSFQKKTVKDLKQLKRVLTKACEEVVKARTGADLLRAEQLEIHVSVGSPEPEEKKEQGMSEEERKLELKRQVEEMKKQRAEKQKEPAPPPAEQTPKKVVGDQLKELVL